MVSQIFLGTQILQRGVLFHVFMVFFPIGVFLYQMLEKGLSMTVRLNGTLFFISLGRFPRYRLNTIEQHGGD